MTYRRDRNIREVYEDRFLNERPGPSYPRAGGAVDRRGPFGRPEDDYNRYDYEGGPRFFPNGGGPRNYHEDQRGFHGDNAHFPGERRAAPPPSRREEFPYRGPREEPHTGGRPMEFSARAPPPHNIRNQGIYPAPRSLPESGEDTLVQAILNLDRGEERDHYRRKAAPFPPLRERSPVRREAARSPHSRSGSSVSSRGYSPDRAKGLPFPSQQGSDGPEGHAGATEHLWGSLFTQQSGHDTLDKIPGLSREGSPHSAVSIKEENHPPEAEKEELPVVAPFVEEESSQKPTESFQERRALAIAAKALEIEKEKHLHFPATTPTLIHPSTASSVTCLQHEAQPAPASNHIQVALKSSLKKSAVTSGAAGHSPVQNLQRSKEQGVVGGGGGRRRGDVSVCECL